MFCEVKTQIVGKTKFFDSLLKREIRLDAPDVLRIFCDGTVCREAAGVCNVHQSHAVPLLLIAIGLAYALLRLCVGREILEAHVAVSRAAVAAVEQQVCDVGIVYAVAEAADQLIKHTVDDRVILINEHRLVVAGGGSKIQVY